MNNNKEWDALWVNGSIATCEQGYGLLHEGAIAIKQGKIAWIGLANQLPAEPDALAENVHDMKGRCMTPGFIDCHTHAVYAGNRAHEFEMRLQGVSYEEIAKQGGGIHSTVSATRAASCDELLAQSLPRCRALLESGVTTLEIKSGYGLDWPTELKILRVIKRIEETLPITVIKTFLGAHTVPREYHDHPDDYVDLICHEMIPAIAKENLADAVDMFCEKIAFNLSQTERVFQAAQHYGLPVKCHSEQLSNIGSATLAAKYHALSVDHLEHASSADIRAIAQSGTVAVLLPGAFYFLRETKMPPIGLLREHQVPIAIASDCNPGTSPIMSILMILNMACTLFRLTPEEAITGVTKFAAKALGIEKTTGTLSVGKDADLAVWNVTHPAELAYYMGGHFLWQLVKQGKVIRM